jgi:hypothetical protein
MTEAMTEDHLDRVLASVGDHLAVPAVVVRSTEPSPVAAVVPLGASRRSRTVTLVAAAAVVALVVLAATTVSPVRDAVARVVEWLDVGSTRIERVDARAADPSGLGSVTEGLPAVTTAEAERALGRPIPSAAALGPPDRVMIPPEGGALLAWQDGTTLWLLPSDDVAGPLLDKLVGEGVSVTRLPDLGDGGAVVTGDHVLQTPHRRVAADTVVLWIDDGLQLRLETDRDPAAAVARARTLAANG